ncbi:hypothetical protein V6N13_097037 [Hibiscus sabdariffa]
MVAAVLQDNLVSREASVGAPQGQQTLVAVGGGAAKNAAYKASNPEKRSKAAMASTRDAVVIPTVAGTDVQVVDHVSEVSRDFHVAVKILEPSVKGRGGQSQTRSVALKGRSTKENVSRGLRVRRPGELCTPFRPTLAELGQNSSGRISQGALLEDTSRPGSVLHSSDGESMYDLSYEDGTMVAEEVERPLVQ